MKKVILMLLTIGFINSSVIAISFDEIADITPAQKQQLTQVQFNYEQKNNALDSRIKEYTNKMELVQKDEDKTEAQKTLLAGAYERNLETLKAQQKILEQETDNLYKSILTEAQFNQFKNTETNQQGDK